ncbi:hypothetical protein Bbelb_429570 [Branchiostoma belcheri]|nr:hypothetical protein Bbelb_429570 [Branchiostoma belcheri]
MLTVVLYFLITFIKYNTNVTKATKIVRMINGCGEQYDKRSWFRPESNRVLTRTHSVPPGPAAVLAAATGGHGYNMRMYVLTATPRHQLVSGAAELVVVFVAYI